MGISSAITASAGTVYRMLEIHVTGAITHRRREATIANGTAITSATTTDTRVSQTCCDPREPISSRLSLIHVHRTNGWVSVCASRAERTRPQAITR